METEGYPGVAVKKPLLTPKAIINQKFGTKACYKVEEVQESTQNGCPGLAISQKGPCLYRCRLQLPEFSVVSETFKKKKEAEQSAAEMALEKLGINPTTSNPTVQEAWDDLVLRLKYLFSNEFLSSLHPLSGHFRAALRREDQLDGSVPVSVITICDTKSNNLCKYINPEVESNPSLVLSLVLRAAATLPSFISISEEQLSIKRRDPYDPEIIQSVVNQQCSFPESTSIEAICIPYSVDKTVVPVTLSVSSNGYYLDVIAHNLSVTDSSKVLISRTIGRASSETRLYARASKLYTLDPSSELLQTKAVQFEGSLNVRASYFSGQDIYGDAILASVGYKWNSADLFHEDVSLRTYYRIFISKIPSGVYKVSRNAILAAELPAVFTMRTNWRGSFPRDLLLAFCRQHHLSEPLFSPTNDPLESVPQLPSSHKKLKVTESGKSESNGGGIAGSGSVGTRGTFRCEIKIFSKHKDLIIQCLPKELYKKDTDAIQNASLKVLSWLNTYFNQLDMSLDKLTSSGDVLGIQFYPQYFLKEFALCRPVHNVCQSIRTQGGRVSHSNSVNQIDTVEGVYPTNIGGPDSGVSPSNGCLACISYTISLVTEGEVMKELLESNEEFEFEIGTGAVITCLEGVVTQMSVGQSACFFMELPPQELILAAAGDSARTLSLISSKSGSLECSVTLLRVTEPLEDRMEQALFSPPLSKQRVQYALQHIKESRATSLVDFGCGSGSLLDSLLDYPTSLEIVVGVDISQKSLARAAKILHSKLSTNSDVIKPSTAIKSATLYEGSITVFDSRLYGFDIGTCLEVIEHMEEDQACLFGDIVLSSFCPKILIVSTPNYEYNVILQRSNLQSQEDPDEKSQSQASKFRNHDHKFEWTREQFNHWASDLATRHNYSVEFSGVGGDGDLEPGFASQIAVFRREDDHPKKVDLTHHYEVLWDLNSTRMSRSAM
ncbi:small RNA 2'-O-methyltransferase-like [Cornus florida]|uniref:small RNA 2'-O-methyltransferase-like n=1 Tax=Cornus florida TaxID=4283 RepID=UPI002896D791|nr:small RNA 2'-O-methyltransferase-like [Cornus florida]